MNKKLDHEIQELFNFSVIHVCKRLKDAESFIKNIVDGSFLFQKIRNPCLSLNQPLSLHLRQPLS